MIFMHVLELCCCTCIKKTYVVYLYALYCITLRLEMFEDCKNPRFLPNLIFRLRRITKRTYPDDQKKTPHSYNLT